MTLSVVLAAPNGGPPNRRQAQVPIGDPDEDDGGLDDDDDEEDEADEDEDEEPWQVQRFCGDATA